MRIPSSRRCARAVASAATRSRSVVMYMIASWMSTASNRGAEAHVAHIAAEMVCVRVDQPAHRQHFVVHVDQRHARRFGKMRRRVAAARAEFEDARRASPERLLERFDDPRGLLRVILRRGEERPPLRKTGVQLRIEHFVTTNLDATQPPRAAQPPRSRSGESSDRARRCARRVRAQAPLRRVAIRLQVR